MPSTALCSTCLHMPGLAVATRILAPTKSPLSAWALTGAAQKVVFFFWGTFSYSLTYFCRSQALGLSCAQSASSFCVFPTPLALPRFAVYFSFCFFGDLIMQLHADWRVFGPAPRSHVPGMGRDCRVIFYYHCIFPPDLIVFFFAVQLLRAADVFVKGQSARV